MSRSGTPQSTAPKRSGRWVIAAPTRSPPFEPPRMAIRSGLAYPFATSHSAAAMKSSKTFCFFASIPSSCHFSPYSSPPRRLGMA